MRFRADLAHSCTLSVPQKGFQLWPSWVRAHAISRRSVAPLPSFWCPRRISSYGPGGCTRMRLRADLAQRSYIFRALLGAPATALVCAPACGSAPIWRTARPHLARRSVTSSALRRSFSDCPWRAAGAPAYGSALIWRKACLAPQNEPQLWPWWVATHVVSRRSIAPLLRFCPPISMGPLRRVGTFDGLRQYTFKIGWVRKGYTQFRGRGSFSGPPEGRTPSVRHLADRMPVHW